MMRTYGIFLLLVAMLIGLGFILVTSPREAYKAPHEDSVEGGTVQDAHNSTAENKPLDAGAATSVAPATNKFRVAILSWEFASPVTAMDSAAFEATVLSVPAAIETRLARGGDDAEGADLAVMPLAEFIGMYDRIRALEPSVIAVAGYSHGIEELTASDTTPPKAGDTVGTSGDLEATTLALYALDFMRVDLSKVKLVSDATDVANATWAAGTRGSSKKRIVLTSADASRLLPYVIVAPRKTREAHKVDTQKFLAGWFAGVARVRSDAPGVAKDLEARKAPLFSAASDKTASALAIVAHLGQIEWAGADDNADAFAVSDNKLFHIDDEMTLSWRLLRTGGAVAVSTPSVLPITKDFIAELAKGTPSNAKPADVDSDAGAPKGLNVLLTRKYDDVDEAAIAADATSAARIFDHEIVRVTVRGGDKASRSVALRARKDAASDRIFPGASTLGTSAAIVEICAAP